MDIFEDDNDKNYFKVLLEKLIELESFKDISIQKESKIEHVYFSLTHRCNLSCTHCSVEANTKSGDDYLNTDEVLGIIDKIVQADLKSIVFTGGELLLRKDFNKIVECTRNNFNGHIILMTNATLINKSNINVLIKCLDSIDISLDGVDEESCSRIVSAFL